MQASPDSFSNLSSPEEDHFSADDSFESKRREQHMDMPLFTSYADGETLEIYDQIRERKLR